MSNKIYYEYNGPIYVNGTLDQVSANGQGLTPVMYKAQGYFHVSKKLNDPHNLALYGLARQITADRVKKALEAMLCLLQGILNHIMI